MLNLKNKTKDEINKIIGDAWLNIYVDEKKLYNPMMNLPVEWEDEPEIYFTYLFTRPEYFSFYCQEILNISLLPYQAVILKELWNHKFPILIASRGAGKSFILAVYAVMRATLLEKRQIVVVGSAFRQSKVIYEYIEKIYDNAPLLRSMCGSKSLKSTSRHMQDMWKFHMNDSTVTALPIGDGQKIRGQRAQDILSDEFSCVTSDTLVQTEKGLMSIKDYLGGNVECLINKDMEKEFPDQIFRTPKTDVYKITTDNGYSFKCSSIHQFMTVDGWVKLEDAKVKQWIQLDCNDYFPSEYIEKNKIKIDERMGWFIGAMISEGTNTNRNYILITSTDKKYIEQCKNNIDYEGVINTRPAYVNKRGWNCKESFNFQISNTELRETLYDLGVDYVTSHRKTIPSCILQSPRSVVVAFLKGLFEGDGTCFTYTEKASNKTRLGLAYYSVNEKLIDELQILLLKFGISGSKNNRASKISDNSQWMLSMRGKNAFNLYKLLDIKKFKDKVESSSFHKHSPCIRENKNSPGRYILETSRMNKNKYLGSFGSVKEAKKYFKDYEKTPRIFVRIKSIELLDKKEVLYDFHMPKTHSFIGNGFVQHNSQSEEVFENVISGFASVKSDPIQGVKQVAANKMYKFLEQFTIEQEKEDDVFRVGNQTILSGTAYYEFNHFCRYWTDWKEIINSGGEKEKLQRYFKRKSAESNEDSVVIPDNFNWKDFLIVRIPIELIPKGFMDESNIARAKATINSSQYNMEYSSCFSRDSQGFFKRSLIESCVAKYDNKICLPSEANIEFKAVVRGNSESQYVFGIDPASQVDNFCIVVLEVKEDHKRIVYCWTSNSKEHKELVLKGIVEEDDFYAFCSRKIRQLKSVFPCNKIGIDSQGGGYAICDSLHDKARMFTGELPFWETIQPGKPKDTDGKAGEHIIELVQFANYDWLSSANHGLRKDFEDKTLLFPSFDPLELGLANISDSSSGRNYDTLEECVIQIEELKDELSTIIMSQTVGGQRDKWDTPEIRLPGNKKGRMRKDRYSALIIANAVAKNTKEMSNVGTTAYGGFANSYNSKEKNDGDMWIGPDWLTKHMSNVY